MARQGAYAYVRPSGVTERARLSSIQGLRPKPVPPYVPSLGPAGGALIFLRAGVLPASDSTDQTGRPDAVGLRA